MNSCDLCPSVPPYFNPCKEPIIIRAKWVVRDKYNYPAKLEKKLKEGDTKYFDKLVKKGIIIFQ